ncbi:CDKN2A-interacting protein isoform X3 [Microcaecilia unicolor]|uniref:CDKN2A-interacting protein isoform X3 n=1 Tax=Microcaecilia unicolor TaxID=1415580 RepID=A0A6P7X1Z6_9AMPH|nr:CDKN2A-interacting protein isoform X3 [Microcaecilia unicolor]
MAADQVPELLRDNQAPQFQDLALWVDEQRGENEPEKHWAHRREFILRNLENFGVPDIGSSTLPPSSQLNRLIAFSMVWANHVFMGCRYPVKVMDKVLTMGKGIEVNDAPTHTTRDELVSKVKKRGISSSNEGIEQPCKKKVPEDNRAYKTIISDVDTKKAEVPSLLENLMQRKEEKGAKSAVPSSSNQRDVPLGTAPLSASQRGAQMSTTKGEALLGLAPSLNINKREALFGVTPLSSTDQREGAAPPLGTNQQEALLGAVPSSRINPREAHLGVAPSLSANQREALLEAAPLSPNQQEAPFLSHNQEAPLGAAPFLSHNQESPLGAAPFLSHNQEAPLGAAPFLSHNQEAPLGAAPSSSHNQEALLGAAPSSSSNQREAPLGAAPSSSVNQGEAQLRDAPSLSSNQGEAPLGEAPSSSVNQGEAPLGAAPSSSSNRETPLGAAPSSSTNQEAPLGAAPSSSTNQREAPLGAAPSSSTNREAPLGEAPSSSTNQREAPLGEAPSSSTNQREAPLGEAPSSSTNQREAPLGAAPSSSTNQREAPLRAAPSSSTNQQDAPLGAAPSSNANREAPLAAPSLSTNKREAPLAAPSLSTNKREAPLGVAVFLSTNQREAPFLTAPSSSTNPQEAPLRTASSSSTNLRETPLGVAPFSSAIQRVAPLRAALSSSTNQRETPSPSSNQRDALLGVAQVTGPKTDNSETFTRFTPVYSAVTEVKATYRPNQSTVSRSSERNTMSDSHLHIPSRGNSQAAESSVRVPHKLTADDAKEKQTFFNRLYKTVAWKLVSVGGFSSTVNHTEILKAAIESLKAALDVVFVPLKDLADLPQYKNSPENIVCELRCKSVYLGTGCGKSQENAKAVASREALKLFLKKKVVVKICKRKYNGKEVEDLVLLDEDARPSNLPPALRNPQDIL